VKNKNWGRYRNGAMKNVSALGVKIQEFVGEFFRFQPKREEKSVGEICKLLSFTLCCLYE
jgi:hypothetical protein